MTWALNWLWLFNFTVKAGGMRIVQHKSGNSSKPAQDLEDVTGLTVFINIFFFFLKDFLLTSCHVVSIPSASHKSTHEKKKKMFCFCLGLGDSVPVALAATVFIVTHFLRAI